MASSPRAIGANFRLLHKTESTYGTAPSGDWAQVPCFSFDLGGTADLLDDPALSAAAEVTRDANGYMLGRSTIAGQAVVPVDLESLGSWLRLLLGAPSTSGSSDYTHSYVSGAATLPSAAFEKALTQITKYSLLTGVKANTMALVATTDQRPRATFGLLGQDEAISGSSSAGTPTFAGMTGFHQSQCSLTLGGSAFPNVSSFSLNYSNGMEPFYDLNSADTVLAIDEGRATCSGSITLRVSEDGLGLITDAIAGTRRALVLKYEISATKSIAFAIPQAALARASVPINGPGGIDITVNFFGEYNASAGEMLQVDLKNQIASYA